MLTHGAEALSRYDRLKREAVRGGLSYGHPHSLATHDPWQDVGANPKSILGGNLVIWLRSDLGITLNGSTVSSWTDQTTGKVFSQGTAAQQPTYNTGGLGGKQFLTWNAASSANMVLVGPTALFSAQPLTVFLVVQKNGTTVGIMFDSSNASRAFIQWSGTLFWLRASTTVNLTAGDLPTTGDCLCAVYNGASSSGYENNSQTPVQTGNAGTGFPDGAWQLGNGVGGGASFTGNMYEFVAATGAAGNAQIQQMFKYFSSRYGIAVS